MSEVEDFFDTSVRMAKSANVASLDDDPEQAARSLELSEATGVPSTAIFGDLEGFERQNKAALGSQIISDNHYIADYLNSHPMAPRVSHDDLGQLDIASRSIDRLHPQSYLQRMRGALGVGRLSEIAFPDDPFGSFRQFYATKPNEEEWALKHPVAQPVLKGLEDVIGTPIVFGSTLLQGASNLIKEFGGRDLAAMLEYEVTKGEGNAFTKYDLPSVGEALRISSRYLRADREPGPGVHPYLDEIKSHQAKEDADALNEALSESAKSATRDRSPDFYANFVRSHVGDREIGIDAEAVRKLYGDKIPEPDDNLLGWVPDLQSKLAAAEGVGGDIRVPLADWLARVEPDVAKELHDFIRVRDGGLTLDEAKGLQPQEAVAEPHTLLRAEGGFEPLFSIGDRKLSLQRKPTTAEGDVISSDKFDVNDQTGKRIGSIEAVPYEGGKRVYIDNILGFSAAGQGPNLWGPSLVRSLIGQLKQEYPQMQQLGGFRVTGARDAAGKPAEAWVDVSKFDERVPDGWGYVEPVQEILNGTWQKVGQQEAFVRSDRPIEHDILDRAVREELNRIVPNKLGDIKTVEAIRGGPGSSTKGGVYQRFANDLPRIMVALDRADVESPVGIARHEAIHHLRKYGFLDEKEWATLEQASKDQDWSGAFLEGRYGHLAEEARLEESIAEAFRIWRGGKEMPEGVEAIFRKIKEFFEAIKTKFKELAGKDLNWEEIFKKIDTGEIGGRESTTPLANEAGQRPFNEPQASFAERESPEMAQARLEGGHEPEPSAVPEAGIFDRAKAMGVTQAHMDRMLKLIAKRNEEDLAKAQARAERQQKRQQTKEWKERRTDLRDEVREQMESRPDFATDALFAKGDVKLHPDFLSDEQKARLPKEYIQKKAGVNPDDLAPYFGYTSGDALVDRLSMLTEDRRSAGMTARDYFNRMVDIETDRRLNQEFGDLQQRIMDEAKDQALSETQLDLVHEETMAYAMAAGQEPQFTREQVRDMVRQAFDTVPVGQISSDRLIQTSGKLGRKIEEAASKGDWAEAYRLSQQRNHATIAAKLARDYERSRAALDRTAKTFRKREVPSVAQEYTNWVHDLLMRVGYPVNRSVQDLAENIARQSETTLSDFVDAKRVEWMGLRDLPIADAFLESDFRTALDDLRASDFREFRNAIDVLVKAGRDEKKIYREGEAADRTAVLQEMISKLETFPLKEYPATKGFISKKLELPKAWLAGMTNIETLLNRWDRADPRGIYNTYISYPLARASNQKNVLERQAAKNLEKLGPLKDRDKLVDAPFVDPLSRTTDNPDGSAWTGFTRANVMAMVHNAGNKSNWKVLARGYGADPDALMRWLLRNSDKEMWDRAQKMGDLFKGLAEQADRVYERLTGATIEKIRLEPIDTPFGKYEGWYHPLIRDPLRQEIWEQDQAGQWLRKPAGRKLSIYNDLDNFHISTANGYTKRRTGAIYPLDLSIDSIPSRLRQIIHDIAFREVILETDKVFGNKAFGAEVIKHYGQEYEDLLRPYLTHLAGAESIPSRAQSKAAQLSEYLRQNVISTYIGFNPFTALKHGPTAWVMSMGEVGPKNFLNAVRSLYGQSPELGLSNAKFAMKWSEELQRRERHWQDTIAGEQSSLEGSRNLREKFIEKGSWLVAQSDMLSAKPTWVAAYNKYLADGLSHGQSIELADRAVRRAHGSTAATNQPALVQARGALHGWLTSVYGFFGTAMQRRIEIAHQLNDAYHLVGEGEIGKAARTVPGIAADVFTYVIWPTIVEEWVTGLSTDDRRGWGTHLIAGTFMGLSSSVLYLRDLMHAFVTGQDPGVGLISSPLHDMTNMLRDFKRGKEAMNKQHAGKTVGDTLTVLGHATGMAPRTIDNAIRYGIDLVNHQARAKAPSDVLLGVTRGSEKRRVER
jgi:hypothetical protein